MLLQLFEARRPEGGVVRDRLQTEEMARLANGVAIRPNPITVIKAVGSVGFLATSKLIVSKRKERSKRTTAAATATTITLPRLEAVVGEGAKEAVVEIEVTQEM